MKIKQKQPRSYVLSRKMDAFFFEVYTFGKFIKRFFKELFLPPYEWKEIMRQCYAVGVKSLALITVTGFITGIVFRGDKAKYDAFIELRKTEVSKFIIDSIRK